jgi:hypothetical protein
MNHGRRHGNAPAPAASQPCGACRRPGSRAALSFFLGMCVMAVINTISSNHHMFEHDDVVISSATDPTARRGPHDSAPSELPATPVAATPSSTLAKAAAPVIANASPHAAAAPSPPAQATLTTPAAPAKWVAHHGYDSVPHSSMGGSAAVFPAVHLEEVKLTAIKMGAVAFAVVGDDVWYARYVPEKKSDWRKVPGAVLWVNENAPVPVRRDIGCSRHYHACGAGGKPKGVAPCCSDVLLEMMKDMTRVLQGHGLKWRLTQGVLVSVARDRMIPCFDHDFDPVFEQGKEEESVEIIKREMQIVDKYGSYTEANYYYTLKLAAQLETDWSKYHVEGGAFEWQEPKFHEPYALARESVKVDATQALERSTRFASNHPITIKGATFLVPDSWENEIAQYSGYTLPPDWLSKAQFDYAGYYQLVEAPGYRKGSLLYDEQGNLRTTSARTEAYKALA